VTVKFISAKNVVQYVRVNTLSVSCVERSGQDGGGGGERWGRGQGVCPVKRGEGGTSEEISHDTLIRYKRLFTTMDYAYHL
jgi:hypothetical protein